MILMSNPVTFKSIDEMTPYLKQGGYIFLEPDGVELKLFDVYFDFDLSVEADIVAGNISAKNIKALNIRAKGIEADYIICEYLEVGKGNIECSGLLANKDIKANNIYVSSFFAARDIEATDITACFIRADRVEIDNRLNAEFIDLHSLNVREIVLNDTNEFGDFDLRYIYVWKDNDQRYAKIYENIVVSKIKN